MIDNKSTSIDFIDLDPIFLFSILKRYIIYLIIFASLVSSLVLIYTLNLDKKYKSQAKIVIERDENNIVNIQEYSNMVSSSNRMNNQIALFKSDQVLEYIISNKKNYQQFINFFSENNQNRIQKIFKKKKIFNVKSLKGII